LQRLDSSLCEQTGQNREASSAISTSPIGAVLSGAEFLRTPSALLLGTCCTAYSTAAPFIAHPPSQGIGEEKIPPSLMSGGTISTAGASEHESFSLTI